MPSAMSFAPSARYVFRSSCLACCGIGGVTQRCARRGDHVRPASISGSIRFPGSPRSAWKEHFEADLHASCSTEQMDAMGSILLGLNDGKEPVIRHSASCRRHNRHHALPGHTHKMDIQRHLPRRRFPRRPVEQDRRRDGGRVVASFGKAAWRSSLARLVIGTCRSFATRYSARTSDSFN